MCAARYNRMSGPVSLRFTWRTRSSRNAAGTSRAQVVSIEEMVSKIKAATDARVDRDFLLIARTDAIAVEGFERALERAEIYRAAGADVIFVEALNCEQLPKIAPRVKAPLLYNMAASGKTPSGPALYAATASGKTPFLTKAEIERLGFKLIIYPNWIVLAQIRAASRVLQTLKETGSIAGLANEVASFREFFDLVGMQEVQALESRYGIAEETRARY